MDIEATAMFSIRFWRIFQILEIKSKFVTLFCYQLLNFFKYKIMKRVLLKVQYNIFLTVS